MSLPRLVDDFLDYLDGERHFSAHTVRSYGADLLQFCRFLAVWSNPGDPAPATPTAVTADMLPPGDDLDPQKLSQHILAAGPVDIRAYLAMMRNSGYSKATVARKLATLRSFYKYLVRTSATTTSPVSVIRTPR